MQLPILIEREAGNGYRARSGAPLEFCAASATRDEALQNLRTLLGSQLQKGAELVSLEVAWPLPHPISRAFSRNRRSFRARITGLLANQIN